MRPLLREAYESEMSKARRFAKSGDLGAALLCLQRAHILGQRGTGPHIRAHWEMLRIGWLRNDRREVLGQVSRLLAATLFTWLWVPEGNTGATDVSAFKRMPVSPDLRRLMEKGRRDTQ